jgi:hypothetical protein
MFGRGSENAKRIEIEYVAAALANSSGTAPDLGFIFSPEFLEPPRATLTVQLLTPTYA